MASLSIADLQTGANAVTSFSDIETSGNGLGFLYYLNSATDGSGFIFELTDLDTSGAIAIDPSFALALDTLAGLPDCDATLEFDAALSAFQGLFSFQTDSSDVTNAVADDILYRVNRPSDDTYNDISAGAGSLSVGSFFNALTFSDAIVKSGNVNAGYANQHVKYDFVRHLAKEITGGYSSSDIFTNEAELVNGVVALDATLGDTFNTDISAAAVAQNGASEFLPSNNASSFVRAAHALFNVNLQTSGRQTQLLADIAQASTNVATTNAAGETVVGALKIPLRFSAGDRLAVRLVYKPKGAFAGNSVTPANRSYKVLFKLA